MQASRVPLLYGAAGFGTPGSELKTDEVRVTDVRVAQEIIDVYAVESGGMEVDTARVYGGGTAEYVISELDFHGASLDTKSFPYLPGDHSPKKLRETVNISLKALGRHKIRTLYLHAPDRSVPYEVTLEEISKMHKEGMFESFGSSNFYAWEVAQIHTICNERGYVLPTVYQGPYSILARTNEVELFPMLRALGIRFVAYSVLAGGLLKGNPNRPGGRYHQDTKFAHIQHKIYTSDSQQNAVEMINAIGATHNLSIGEIALRWAQHHSLLILFSARRD